MTEGFRLPRAVGPRNDGLEAVAGKESDGVNGDSVFADFVMKMRAGSVTGGTHFTDCFAPFDTGALGYEKFRHVAEHG